MFHLVNNMLQTHYMCYRYTIHRIHRIFHLQVGHIRLMFSEHKLFVYHYHNNMDILQVDKIPVCNFYQCNEMMGYILEQFHCNLAV